MARPRIGWIFGLAAVLTPVFTLSFYLGFQPRSEPHQGALLEDQAEPIAADTSGSANGTSASSEPKKSDIPSIQELAPSTRAEMTELESSVSLAVPDELPPPAEIGVDDEAALEIPPNSPVSLDGSGAIGGGQARGQILREGTLIQNSQGAITKRAFNMVFVPDDGSLPLSLLENQLLERVEEISLAGERSGQPPKWVVTGRVTEYRGSNYLLLQSALQITSDK